MVEVSSSLLVTSSSVNGLKSPIKRQRLTDGFKNRSNNSSDEQ